MDEIGAKVMYLSSEDVFKILYEKNEYNFNLFWFFVVSLVLIDLLV